jgi:ribosome recycling factor
MLEELLADAKRRMAKSVDSTRHEFASVRTGRASTALLDRIQVDYYGTKTPLNQLATITVPDARLLVVTPYDKSAMKEVERAILESDLGITPSNDGKMIRLPIPPLTEERRKQLAKKVHEIAEHGRTAIRAERREANEAFKRHLKDKTMSEDDEKRGLEQVQKLTDQHVKMIDDMAKHKEEELLKI